MKIFETERLYLRELTLNDSKELMKVLSDEESMRFYPTPFSEKKVREWIVWNIDNYNKYGHGLWAVILKKDDVFIGDCGITIQNIEGESVPEIGYHINKDYCNNGYATEAALECKHYAFENLGYPKIFSYSNVLNIPSQKVAKKIGMKFYKRFLKNNEEQIVYVAIKD